MKSGRKPPAAGELHVWRVELGGDDPRGFARRALGAILAEYLGFEVLARDEAGRGDAGRSATTIELRADENGKPRLAARPERLSFNLSHAGGLALVAIAPGGAEVGVDVERLRPRRDLLRLAERRLPAADAAAVAAAGEASRERVFYAAWTRHEARVKCTGAGVFGPEPGPEVVAWPLEIDAGYAAAIALDTRLARVTEPRVTTRTWEPR
jgi:hypothetical protein